MMLFPVDRQPVFLFMWEVFFFQLFSFLSFISLYFGLGIGKIFSTKLYTEKYLWKIKIHFPIYRPTLFAGQETNFERVALENKQEGSNPGGQMPEKSGILGVDNLHDLCRRG